MRYHRPIEMGMVALVRTRLAAVSGVRINWDYQIQSPDGQDLYVTARVSLVAIDSKRQDYASTASSNGEGFG